MKKKIILLTIFLLIFLSLFQTVSGEENTPSENAEKKIYVEYFYNEDCGSCVDKIYDFVKILEKEYKNNTNVIFTYKEYTSNYDEYQQYKDLFGRSWPFLIIRNETNASIIPGDRLYIRYIDDAAEIINAYIAGLKPKEIDIDVVSFDLLFWHIELDINSVSLPLLTIILGIVDSLNPCAMFILFILLSLLVHVHSRRRMILVGGIFVFFSGLWYLVFMILLEKIFNFFEMAILAIIVGSICLVFGFMNIKDFFFFKKGLSFSIPDSKKPGIYKQIRKLVKTEKYSLLIFGTIFFAVTVNLFELICSLQWPVIYLGVLESHNLSDLQNMSYILFYNILYVIPLIIIVLIFAFTLGDRKLSEWHGQILKLFSGIMITSFGIIFLIDYKLLENITIPIILLCTSILTTFAISYVWKKTKHIEIE